MNKTRNTEESEEEKEKTDECKEMEMWMMEGRDEVINGDKEKVMNVCVEKMEIFKGGGTQHWIKTVNEASERWMQGRLNEWGIENEDKLLSLHSLKKRK